MPDKDIWYFVGQVIIAGIGIWKIGKWTESVNAAVKSLGTHMTEDENKFKDLYEKHNKLRVKVAGISGDYHDPED